MNVNEVSDAQNTALYYYERNEPPKFVFVKPRRQPPAEAKQITVIGEPVHTLSSSSASSLTPPSPPVTNIPSAPPLPSWARPSPSAALKTKGGFKRLNIPKKKKEDEKPKKKAVGMGDLMSELRDKIGGGKMKMKKVETIVGKLHHKKGGGGSKKGFTDIMDELSHTLAKLRGEILDDSPAKSPPQNGTVGESERQGKNIDDEAIGSEKDILTIQPGDDDESKRRKSFTLGVQRLLLGDTNDAEERKNSVTSATGDEEIPHVKTSEHKFSKYETMSKNQLPDGAIRQRMSLDGLSQVEQESFFDKSYLNDQDQSVSPVLGQETLPKKSVTPSTPTVVNSSSRYEKYEKMYRMLPEGAVRQKMSMDGFEDEEIDGFFKNGGVAPNVATFVPLSFDVDDSSKYEKYEKMYRMLPEGAVRQKMSMDGFKDEEIDGFFKNGGVAPSAAPVVAAAHSSITPVTSVPYEPPPLPRPDEIDFTVIIAAPLQNLRVTPLPCGFYVVKQDSSRIDRFGYMLAGNVVTYRNILHIALQDFEAKYGSSPVEISQGSNNCGDKFHTAEPKTLNELHKPFFYDGIFSLAHLLMCSIVSYPSSLCFVLYGFISFCHRSYISSSSTNRDH